MATDPKPEMGDDLPTDAETADDTSTTASDQTPEQMRAEMARMREALKRTNAENAQRRKKLDEYETAKKKQADAELSEAERLKREHAETADALAKAHDDLKATRLAHRRDILARDLGFLDPTDAELADLGDVGFDGDGKPDDKAIKAALKSLLERKPHFKAEDKAEAPPSRGTPRPANGQPAPQVTPGPSGNSAESELLRSNRYARL